MIILFKKMRLVHKNKRVHNALIEALYCASAVCECMLSVIYFAIDIHAHSN